MSSIRRAEHNRRMRSRTVPPHAYFAGSAVFHYLGPAFAVLLFTRVPPLGVAWLRIASAAIVFAVWRRPWRRLRVADTSTVRLVVALGAVLAAMNCCFYAAIARLPLGTVAAIEFLPVIVLAALGVRSVRNVAAVVLAACGVYVLIDIRLRGGALGFGLAFANAGLFALYIVLAHRISRRSSLGGIDGLAAAMLVAVPMVTAIGGWQAGPHLLDPVALGAGIGVGVTSSVIPYVCDQLAMARLRRATYSLMVSLLPATATVIGLVVLGQTPSPRQIAGVALIVAALLAEEVSDGDQQHLGTEDGERADVQPHRPQDQPAGTEVGLAGHRQVPERGGDQLLRVGLAEAQLAELAHLLDRRPGVAGWREHVAGEHAGGEQQERRQRGRDDHHRLADVRQVRDLGARGRAQADCQREQNPGCGEQPGGPGARRFGVGELESQRL
jgi:inner membrane transporter RhtA